MQFMLSRNPATNKISKYNVKFDQNFSHLRLPGLARCLNVATFFYTPALRWRHSWHSDTPGCCWTKYTESGSGFIREIDKSSGLDYIVGQVSNLIQRNWSVIFGQTRMLLMTKKSTFLKAKPAGVLTSLCPHLTFTSPRVALFGELVFRELVHCNTSSNCEPAVKTQRFLLFYDWLVHCI